MAILNYTTKIDPTKQWGKSSRFWPSREPLASVWSTRIKNLRP